MLHHPCGLRIARGMEEKQAVLLCGSTEEEMGNGFVWRHLPQAPVEGGLLAAGLCFYQGDLVTVSLRVGDAGSGSVGWENWTEAEERECVRRTGKWLRGLGYKPGNHRWCEISLGYDPGSGSGGAVVRFHQ
ncbi:hypothetical protein OVA24_10965 [Luteolibacter sp. SL250]|uniref:hypothetical protein n=1 Tax=Luteolibacter sp. SL250 TaxID=2995170 RepID=UPI0022705E02|nr:hypothetical protein [Luteolibacter sp. SL250]WAC17763.1 hypothetical protein OVA24_10965 [Luteolibacter sp. SL250]